ncbi:serine hydrolase domain-containing protein [Nocardia transvalensis]|uniref:serine hydrolase domain-containing protein n=1 Tax=Nocardia transvalensis TaxID=37333 RepID=UPI001895F62D|nr:serine hydrolase domain-containing protein [Nocardia transvalensis]MBF6327710.1 beta-lactamase family protein [Nocardia transvalensis]
MTELLEAVSAEVDAHRLPGAVIAVTADGSLLDLQAVGYLDPDSAQPMRDDAIFRIYSMTKVFTALAALTMVAEGRIRMADPVAEWLPCFGDLRVHASGALRPPRRPLVIEDLMRQTAGIGGGAHTSENIKPYYEKAKLRKFDHRAEPHTLDDVVRTLARQPLAADPGTVWEYGMAMDVLGRILELADNRPLDEIVERRVCGPLGLRDTGFSVAGSDLDRVARRLSDVPGTPHGLVTHQQRPPWLSAGSGGYSTAADFARLLCAIVPDRDGRLAIPALGPITRELFVDRIGRLAGSGPDYIPGKGYGFSYGLHVPSSDPAWAALDPHAHTVGWLGRAATSFVYDIPSGVGAVVMTLRYGRAVHYRDRVRSIVVHHRASSWT